ncbi:MAG: molybdopterin-dependent oxidoreductase [Deltaproteobacteria bacterium]|nr:molybdopterin-dependent oxidoreductase [Deltaproteobacteria bacterium]
MQAITDREGERQVRTMCRLCLNRCGILATVRKGRVVRIDGDPANPYNQGKACAKGRAGFYTLDSPYRVTRPLRRTNPEKGPGIDPGWEPISWSEALDLVAGKLKEIIEDDPRKLWRVTFDRSLLDEIWCAAFGTSLQSLSSGFFCGNAVHPMHFLNQFAAEAVPDVPLTRYILSVGGQYGAVVHYDTMNGAFELGRNREQIRVVVVDPFCSHAAGMADEWVPIRPGTDAAFLLGLINVLINELGIYDAAFLKQFSNAPYLIGGDGRYARDPATRKVLVWDAAEDVARPFDAGVSDPALSGCYRVFGEETRPAFQVIADQVRRYTPEEVSRITSVSAVVLRRIAREFGEAARIGATITIGGQELPYRPACITWYRGLSSHKHALMNGFAAMLLQTLIGGLDVPGGLMGYHRVKYRTTEDGLLATMAHPGRIGSGPGPTNPYPPRTVTPPQSIDLFELFPVACYSRTFAVEAILKPEKYHAPIKPKMLLQRRSNMAFTGAGRDLMAEVLRSIPFIVSFALEIDETAEFADVVFPDLHYLEQLEPVLTGEYHTGSQPATFYGSRPVLTPPFDSPWDQHVSHDEILLELAARAGFVEDVYVACNAMWKLPPAYALRSGERYSYQDLMDRALKAVHGADKGLEWYGRDGILVKERSVRERYPGAFPKPRIHIYHEYMIDAGRQVESVTRELKIPWDCSGYLPLVEWRPCPAHTPKSPEFDVYMITAKAPYHALTATGSNPLLREVGLRLGYHDIVLSEETAKRKGLRNGEWVEIETDSRKKATGQLKLTSAIHPEVALVWASAGRWANSATQGGKPLGIHFNSLLTMDDEHLDFVSAAVDSCLRVKITRLGAKS